MGFGDSTRINTNVQSLQAYTSLQKTNAKLGMHQLRLATGSRINSAEDDSAGYSIAKKLEAKVRGQAQALSNIGDAKGMLTVAEGSLSSVMDILQTMKEKAVQAANDSMGEAERTAIQNQLSELSKEIEDVLGGAEFNGTTLFTNDPAGVDLNFQVGAGSDDSFGLSFDPTSKASLIGGSSVSTEDANGVATWNGGDVTVESFTGTNTSYTITRGADSTAYDYSASAVAAGTATKTGTVTDGKDAVSNILIDGDTTTTATAAVDVKVRVKADGNTLEYTTDGTNFQDLTDGTNALQLSSGGTLSATIAAGAGAGLDLTFDIDTATFDADDGVDIAIASGSNAGTATKVAGTLDSAQAVDDISSAATFSVNGAVADATYQFRVKSDNATLEYSTDGTTWADVATDTAVTAGAAGTYSIDDGSGNGLTITLAAGTTLAADQGFNISVDQGASSTQASFTASAGTVAYDSVNDRYTLTDGTNSLVFSANATGSAVGESFTVDAAAGGLNVTSHTDAQATMETIDSAITKLSGQLGKLGDAQNRLSFKQENLQTSMTNYEAARSRIIDADFAKEQMEIVKLQILQQTGIASLAQANAAPQSVLSLF